MLVRRKTAIYIISSALSSCIQENEVTAENVLT